MGANSVKCSVCGTTKNVKIVQHLATVKTREEENRIRRIVERQSGKHIKFFPFLCPEHLKEVKNEMENN